MKRPRWPLRATPFASREAAFAEAAAFGFVFTLGVTIVKSVAAALLLSRLGSAPMPPLYIASAIVVGLATAGVARGLRARPPTVILRAACVISGGTLLLLAAASTSFPDRFVPVLYVFGEVYATVVAVLFWSMLGEALDPREQRHTFVWFSGISMAGILTGGLAMHLVPQPIPAIVVLAGVAITLIASPSIISLPSPPRTRLPLSLSYVRERRYPKLILALVFLLALLTAVIDFLFRARASVLFDERHIARVFGDLNAAVALTALLFQSLITPRLLPRLGLFGFLALSPMLMVALSLVVLAFPNAGIAPLFALKTWEMVSAYALVPAAAQLLYNPMPLAERAAVRVSVDGAGKRMGTALCGLVLVIVAAHSTSPLLPMAIALAALVIIPVIRRAYLHELAASLGSVERDSLIAIDAHEPTTRAVLERALESGDARAVSAASTVLARTHYDFAPHVARMLSHADAEVRRLACELAGAHGASGLAPRLAELLSDSNPDVRWAAAGALGAVDPDAAVRYLEPMLADESDPVARCAAIAALWTSRVRRDLASYSIRALADRLRSLDVVVRAAFATLLGALGNSPYSSLLEQLLADPEAQVRRAAARSAALTRDPTLVPALLARLSDRDSALAVREALTQFGDFAVPKIWAMLDDRTVSLRIRMKLPHLLRQIGTALAAEACLYSNSQDDPALQHKLIIELFLLHKEQPELVLDRRRTDEAIRRRLELYAVFAPLAKALEAAPLRLALLAKAANERKRQTIAGIFKLLALHRDENVMLSISRGLLAAEARAQANALELLDEALARDPLHDTALAAFESMRAPPSLTPERAVSQLSISRDSLLRSLARQFLEDAGLQAGVPLISAIAQYLNPTTEEGSMAQPVIERVLLLESVPMLSAVSVDDIAALAQICKERAVLAGEVIFTEGETGSDMFIITRGAVAVAKSSRLLMTLGVGEVFGQISLLDSGPRSATTRAESEGAHLLAVARQPFMDLAVDRPELLTALFRVLTKRLRDLIA